MVQLGLFGAGFFVGNQGFVVERELLFGRSAGALGPLARGVVGNQGDFLSQIVTPPFLPPPNIDLLKAPRVGPLQCPQNDPVSSRKP